MKKTPPRLVLAMLSALSLAAGSLRAQATPATDSAASRKDDQDETVVLSPFVVTAEEDEGYQATATLAGARTRTELKDVASSIQVVTQQFLTDTKAKDNQTLLPYTTNTEVGGIYGNYAGVGNTFIDGAAEGPTNLLRPNGNTRVRGLDSADNTRDLILTDIPWNGFNVGRVDFQRGPNSILFGLGSPAGIINASPNTATYRTGGNIENQLSSFGSDRTTLDYNHVLVPNTLAIRVDAVYDDQKYRQEPAFNKDRRVFGALRWDPNLFGKNSTAHTTLRLNYEHGKVDANRPRSLPPIDRLTPFFDPNGINKRLIDPWYDYTTGLFPWTGPATGPGAQQKNYWLGTGAVGGNNPNLFYYNNATAIMAMQGSPYGYYAPGHQLGGFPFAVYPGIATYGEHAKNIAVYGAANGVPQSELAAFAGGQTGFYKARQITDPSIFDFYNHLIDGPTKKEWQGWDAGNISLEQTFFNDRLGFQFVYDKQRYHDGGENLLGWSPYLTVDIAKYNMEWPSFYADAVLPNPNAGRAYTAGQGSGSSRATLRENLLFTGRGELRASDLLRRSLLQRLLGRHVITGVYSREKYDVEDRNWVRYAATGQWSELNGRGYVNGGDGTGGIRSGDVIVNSIVYLSDSLLGKSSAAGLDLSRINNDPAPSGALPIKYFDAHWKWPTDPTNPNYVDPTAPWTNPTTNPPSASTQQSNPFNLVGWQTATVPILNADKGDIDQLYKDASKTQKITKSKAGTWQAFLWDDTIVATVGYRKDRQEQRYGASPQDVTGLASMNYDLAPLASNGVAEGSSTTWGVVVHTPRVLREKLPWGTDISLSYNNGKNTRVENRYGFNGQQLPNARGETKDISLAISTLNDRLTFKVTHYVTDVKDANISSVTSQTSTLGNNTTELENFEAWGTASALMDIAGMKGDFPGWEWYWNWAEIAGEPGTGAHAWDNAYWDPVGSPDAQARFAAHPETIKEKAAIQSWLDQMQPQSWFDAFGYPINVAKAKAGDYAHAISNGAWQPASYLGSVQPAGAGRVNGVWPTGTVDNRSKGWEFEVTGKPIHNLDVMFNASKQFASQVALGQDLVAFIEACKVKYDSPAGDLRMWWGGDNSFRYVFNQDVWSAYQFQKKTNGKMVSEMAPWRFNGTLNYTFDHGWLKGVNIGGSYRWQQGVILGYRINAAGDNLDINKPLWGPAQDWVDLWAGRAWKISRKLTWRTQVNLRSVGKSARLTPISVQPDGSPGQYRIEEGMTWMLSNTLSF